MAPFKLRAVVEAPPTDIIGYLVPDQQGFRDGLEPRSGHWPGIFMSGKAQLGSQLGSGSGSDSSPGGKAVYGNQSF